jgi:hypothetical protein
MMTSFFWQLLEVVFEFLQKQTSFFNGSGTEQRLSKMVQRVKRRKLESKVSDRKCA